MLKYFIINFLIFIFLENVFKERCQQARLLNAFENNITLLSRFPWFDNRVKGYVPKLVSLKSYTIFFFRCLIGCRRNFIGKNCTICNKQLTK